MSASASKKKRKELETQGLSQKDIRAKKETDKRKKTTRNILIAVVAVLLVAAIVVGVIALLNHRYRQTVATVGDQKISIPVYNCFYANAANQVSSQWAQYGYNIFQPNIALSKQENSFGEGTMEDYMIDYTNRYLQSVYIIYVKAQADSSFSLSKESKDSIASTLKNLETEAENYGYPDVDKFLEAQYGRGVTKDDFETYLTISATVAEYDSFLQTSFAPTDEELKAAYDADPAAYDIVSYSYSDTVAAGKVDKEDESKTLEITDEDRAEAKTKAEEKETNKPDDVKDTHVRKGSVSNEEMANWLFDAARKEGDVKTFKMDEAGNNYRTVWYTGRDTNDYNRVNAYVIQIDKEKAEEPAKEEPAPDTEKEEAAQPGENTPETEAPETEAPETEAPNTDAAKDTGEDGKKDDEKKDDEKKDEEEKLSPEETLAKITDGLKPEMTDKEFEEYVKAQYKAVSSSLLDKLDYPEEVNAWIFDAARKAGEYETIETEDAYFVVRYVSTNETTYRSEIVKNDLYNKMYNKLMESATIDVDKKALKYANTDLTFRSSGN